MTPWADIESGIDSVAHDSPQAAASAYLAAGVSVLENWVEGRDMQPTLDQHEGFRLLALQRQGASGEPSFHACRETCRELAYHYNVIHSEPDHAETAQRLQMMALVATHLMLFVRGKQEVAELGEFCCASKPIRAREHAAPGQDARS